MKNNIYKKQPPLIEPDKIEVPIATIERLSNGVNLHTLDCSDYDVIRVSFVFLAGSLFQDAPFSASSTANLLSEGSKLSSSQQITERLDFYGSYYNVSLDRDYVIVTFVSLSKFFEQTMDIAREIILMPSFEPHEVEIYRERHKQRLAMERTRVASKARELFAQALFGENHPYGISSPESEYDKLTSEIIKEFYKEHYVAERCFVVCSGKIRKEEKNIISEMASQIPSSTTLNEPLVPKPACLPYVFEAHKDALQSSVRVGRMLFPRSHPDFIGMQVIASILGGYFGSRLMNNLREEHGYTYGVFASMVNMKHAGYLAIATDVATEVTSEALIQIFKEIEILRNEVISDDELHSVRNIMFGEVMRILDGPFGIADVSIENISNETDNNYVELLLDEIRNITPQRIQELAVKYLDRDSFTTVVVGNPKIESQLL